MSPVILSCLVSSVLSFLVIILHTAIELALRARGPMRYLCGETAEYGQGFLAMLRVCIVFVLLQTTVSFLGVAFVPERYVYKGFPLLRMNYQNHFPAGTVAE